MINRLKRLEFAKLSLLGFVLLILAVPSTAVSTTVAKLDAESLVAKSSAIVQGEVRSVESRREDGRVFTYVDIQTEQVLKGNPGKTVQIKHIGGVDGKWVTRVHGMPAFTAGESVIVFLEAKPEVTHFVVTGLKQGKFSIQTSDGPESEKYVVPDTDGLRLVDKKTKADKLQLPGQPNGTGYESLQKAVWRLETFKAFIESIVDRQNSSN